MSYSATVFKILIASPSDVPGERVIIRDVIHEWNAVHAEKRGIVLLPVGWETHSSPEMGNHPQTLINAQLASDCDLLIGVFWTRVGTETDKYISGSVEEIERHIAAEKLAMIYFSAAPVVPDSIDIDQYAKLKQFKESCRKRGLYESYSDIMEFKEKLYRHIQLKVNQHPSFEMATPMADQIEPLISERVLPKISPEAVTLLKAAAASKDGTISHHKYLGGAAIQVGQENFLTDQSPRSAALWEGSIDELESLGLARATDVKRNMFRLTREGYDMAEIVKP